MRMDFKAWLCALLLLPGVTIGAAGQGTPANPPVPAIDPKTGVVNSQRLASGVPLGDVGRQLHVVLDRLQRLLVSVEADEPDPGGGNEGKDAVEHPDTGPEDRHDGHFLSRDPRHRHVLERRVDLHFLDREILRDLVCEQDRELVHELAEELRWRLLVSQEAELT